MKTLSMSLLSVLFAAVSFAQYNQSQNVNLIFNTNGNRTYQVMIDGTSYYSNSTSTNNTNYNNVGVNSNATYSGNTITISNLQTGQHTLQVYRIRNNNNDNGYNNNNTYNNNNNSRSVYSSTFTLRPNFGMDITIGNNGAVSMSEKQMNNNRRNRRYRNDNGYNNNGTYNNGNSTRLPMSESNFNSLVRTVRGKWFQSSKVTSERDAFNNSANYFTSSQVRQLLQLINTEANRLDLARLSYSRVVDPANFSSQLYDLFSNQASKDELDSYARQYRY